MGVVYTLAFQEEPFPYFMKHAVAESQEESPAPISRSCCLVQSY